MLKEGEFIYLYNEKATFLIPYRDKSSFSTHKGNLKFEGELSFGDKVVSNQGEEFFILRPTIADLMMKVKRRTTIIYPKEAGVIVMELGVQSGSRVIEIGTGSGSLSILLSRIVGETGRIYSFERREEHLENAKKNIDRFALPNIDFFLRDPVAEGGFGISDADAIFVDVPAPWDLMEHAHAAIVPGGFIGVLSPNIEQVQKAYDAMHAAGFVRIRCQEILARGLRVKKNLTRPFDRMIGHTGYLYFAQKASKSAVAREPDYSI